MNKYGRSSEARGLSAKQVAKSRKNYIKKRTNKNGPGYSTSRAGSEYKFDISIDFSDYVKNMEEAKRQLADATVDIEKQFRTKFARQQGNKTVQSSITLGENNTNKIRADIRAMYNTDRFKSDVYQYLATDIGQAGVANIRYGIKNPASRPLSFRYESGTMFNKVDFKKRKNANSVVIRVGWNDTFYKYFDFQERGTSQIGGMFAIRNAYRRTTPAAMKSMLQFMRNYTEKGGFSGRYTR